MVTPLRDGTNLVAKEYVATQDTADPGVLVLWKFAGAAAEMTEAPSVNPYSMEETADGIRGALEMTHAERCTCHGALLAGVPKHDAAAWSQSFLEHLKRVRSTNDQTWCRPVIGVRASPVRENLTRIAFDRSEKLTSGSAGKLGLPPIDCHRTPSTFSRRGDSNAGGRRDAPLIATTIKCG